MTMGEHEPCLSLSQKYFALAVELAMESGQKQADNCKYCHYN